MEFGQNVCVDAISNKFMNLCHVGSKNRSLGQILEKPCARSRGYIFCLILMKLGQNVCVNPLPDDKILDWSKLKQIAKDILKCI